MVRLRELEEWLSVKDAAERIGITRQAVLKRLNEGRMGRAVKTRIGWLIEPESVEQVRRERSGEDG